MSDRLVSPASLEPSMRQPAPPRQSAAASPPPPTHPATRTDRCDAGTADTDAAAARAHTHCDAAAGADADARPADRLNVAQPIHAIMDDRSIAARLSADDRRACVERLTDQGMTTAEIGEFLDVNERTIRRDRAATRAELAIAPGLDLGHELFGELHRVVQQAAAGLFRMVRDHSAPPYTRVWAAEAAVRNQQRLVETAHKLRYFPTGDARLSHLAKTDPAEQQRRRAAQQAELDAIYNRPTGPTRPGLPDLPDTEPLARMMGLVK